MATDARLQLAPASHASFLYVRGGYRCCQALLFGQYRRWLLADQEIWQRRQSGLWVTYIRRWVGYPEWR